MTGQIDSNRSLTQQQPLQQDSPGPRQGQGADSGTGDADRVSLDSSKQAEKTYGPQATLNVASPYELLRNLVVKTLQEQNVPMQVSTGSTEIDLSNLSVAEAKELVADDGYFGVEKTSERIVSFAINAFGNDPTRLDEMKGAIEQGFQDAQQAFGGSLPEISQQTYDAIMEKLTAFAEESIGSGE